MARDRLLAIGSTGTFHSNSGPNAEMKATSPILGAVFKLQRMRNRIKQILQMREVMHPPAAHQRAGSVTRTALKNVRRASATVYKR